MKTPKHTKGPWKVYTSGYPNAKHTEYEEHFKVGFGETKFRGPGFLFDMLHPVPYQLGYTNELREEAKANAHLIASAPEMFEALENLLCAMSGNGTITVDSPIELNQAFQDARKVLFKAKGEL